MFHLFIHPMKKYFKSLSLESVLLNFLLGMFIVEFFIALAEGQYIRALEHFTAAVLTANIILKNKTITNYVNLTNYYELLVASYDEIRDHRVTLIARLKETVEARNLEIVQLTTALSNERKNKAKKLPKESK